MARYSINKQGVIGIDFEGVIPDIDLRTRMKAVSYRWNPSRKIWWAYKNRKTLALAKEICVGNNELVPASPVRWVPPADYALKVTIGNMLNASPAILKGWEAILKAYVNGVMSEDNVEHSGQAVSRVQTSVWMDCFDFIRTNLTTLPSFMWEFELIFEYSLPGTVHQRPDVFLLTNSKAILLEFKKKISPQIDSNKDDVTQAIRYKEWLENHHKVTRERNLDVNSYLVCTPDNSVAGTLRGVEILTKDNFCSTIERELTGEIICTFTEEWIKSPKTEMPDMLQAIEIMYREGRIPYISDVNKKSLKAVQKHIEEAKRQQKKILILINGVPGAGKTAVGQSVVYEQNRDGQANAVYLSGNGPLVEVLQYQINQVGNNKHMGENAIQGLKEFKTTYFSKSGRKNTRVPDQSVLIFDEAQRAWDAATLDRGFSEPQGLFDVGNRIYESRGYAVLIGLYGDGQSIYKGEEAGMSLWEEALKQNREWSIVASDSLMAQIHGHENQKILDDDLFLPVSLRADFIDCSKWVEQAIGRTGVTQQQAQVELAELQKTSMRICVTRDFDKVRARTAVMNQEHPDWKYGILISNFAEQSIIRKALPYWNIGYRGSNEVSNGRYGSWFAGDCKELNKACSVYGNQGLELDCPIILFGGGYVRQGGQWIARGATYNRQKEKFQDPETIVENNFRVLLTRARKEMILLIPNDPVLDETYNYFVSMGMDLL
ncbi:TPA: DNA/RNA helicase domain-containing protein [Streptococcus suis]